MATLTVNIIICNSLVVEILEILFIFNRLNKYDLACCWFYSHIIGVFEELITYWAQ